jgi:hypothetical protein
MLLGKSEIKTTFNEEQSWQRVIFEEFGGDIIKLPAGTMHGSKAHASGAKYIIAFNDVKLP